MPCGAVRADFRLEFRTGLRVGVLEAQRLVGEIEMEDSRFAGVQEYGRFGAIEKVPACPL